MRILIKLYCSHQLDEYTEHLYTSSEYSESTFILTNFSIQQKIEDASTVSFNLDFSNKRTKFKITASLQKETPQQEVSIDYNL